MRRQVRKWIWIPLGALLMWALLGTFVIRAYPVSSGSMEPVFFGDPQPDRVMVRLGRFPLERYDLVVFKRAEDGEPVVKRVIGLPGESVQLAGGDLFLSGRRLAGGAPRSPWIDVFDEALHPLDLAWTSDEAPLELERAWDEPGWVRCPEDARGAGPREVADGLSDFDVLRWNGPGTGRLELRWRPTPVPLDRDGQRTTEADVHIDANDLRVAGEVRLGADATFRVFVTEAGQRVELRANAERITTERVALNAPAGDVERAPWPGGDSGWVRFELSNRDNFRQASFGSMGSSASYDSDLPYPGSLPPGRSTLGPRVEIHVTGKAELRGLVVQRDLFHATGPTFGPQGDGKDVVLGPNEIFVLGDNTLHSLDSRSYGPIELSEVIGRPVAITRPLDRARWLSEVEAQAPEAP